jgi:excisionase family DNA binding protein
MKADDQTDRMEPLMTAETVAERLSISLSMVYKLRRSGALPSVQVGALYRFHPDAVRAFMRGERPAGRDS